MAWLISRAMMDFSNSLCSREQVAESLAENCLDGEPSAPLKSTPMPQACLLPGKTTAPWTGSRFGQTFAVSDRGTQGAEKCLRHFAKFVTALSSAGGFPAKTSPSLEKAKASAVNDQGCGASKPASFARYNHDSRSWKTPQRSLEGGFTEFSVTWPKWGTMRNGVAYQQKTLSGLKALRAWITSERESGSSQSAPTPNTIGYRSDGELRILARLDLEPEEFKAMTHRAANSKRLTALRLQTPTQGNKVRSEEFREGRAPSLLEFTRVPTPRSADGSHLGANPTPTTERRTASDQANLSEFIQETTRVPTPHGFSKDGKSNGPSGNELGRAVNRMPTPTRHNAKECNAPSESERNTPTLAAQVGGSLNPMWVEWLMGWPVGWTDLQPLEMGKFRRWLRLHGESCQDSSNWA